jgi:hypothetical protein
MKIIVRSLFVVLILLLIIAAWMAGPYWARVRHVAASPSNGFHADFYLYISPGASHLARQGKESTILVQPNNSGINSDDPNVHRRDAWFTGFERKSIADELGVILLVPAFIRPAEDWQIYTHALDRDTLMTERVDLKRIDLQLIAMIDFARAELAQQGFETDEKVLIQGFSASAMFANRFTILHPERVKAATIGSPGGWPIVPTIQYNGEQLPYPAGVADLDVMTGSPFDFETYTTVPQLIYMGSLDDNDSVDFADGWDESASQLIDTLFGIDPLSRWEDVQAIYRSTGANTEFLLIDGIGHDRKALQTYSTEFFKKILANE